MQQRLLIETLGRGCVRNKVFVGLFLRQKKILASGAADEAR